LISSVSTSASSSFVADFEPIETARKSDRTPADLWLDRAMRTSRIIAIVMFTADSDRDAEAARER